MDLDAHPVAWSQRMGTNRQESRFARCDPARRVPYRAGAAWLAAKAVPIGLWHDGHAAHFVHPTEIQHSNGATGAYETMGHGFDDGHAAVRAHECSGGGK